ncbi:unnamed protein product [Rhodiola kirilowii]
MWRASSGVNFLLSLLMMVFDSLLYCALGLYCDKVLRGENGTRNLWNYLFQKCSLKTKKSISLEMKQQELDGRCIQIRNLHKEYTSRKGNCCAVNSLQLTLYENQILALLGHNGAGKSTTISMLVGLLPPTSGDALVFGKNITTEMVDVRKILGVCPQHDILFPELTVREHLELFGILKGVEEDILPNTVSQMVDEVGLADKHDTVVRALSGGMKRKLSLAIALIGNSKVIVLDEPTSGMDPYSMRLTWQIAILAGGSLKCCGSSMFLKHQYGVGYTLTLVKSAPTVPVAADIVYRHIPSAICVSEVGTEISFKLPLSSSSSFESMFREIESQMGGGGGGPIPFDLSSQISIEVAEYVKGGWIQSLNKTYESRYGAVVMDDQNPDGSVGYTVLHNSSCQHAAPTYINVVNAAILRLATCNKNMTLQARNHPLPMTKSQHMQRHDLDAFSAAVIVNIAFSFIPASFAVSLVKHFFRLSPGFCFADGLASLALLRQGMKDGSNDSVLDWNVTGASLSYLGIESVAYFLLALMLEQFQPNGAEPSANWLSN